jgi:hypothetical protein
MNGTNSTPTARPVATARPQSRCVASHAACAAESATQREMSALYSSSSTAMAEHATRNAVSAALLAKPHFIRFRP